MSAAVDDPEVTPGEPGSDELSDLAGNGRDLADVDDSEVFEDLEDGSADLGDGSADLGDGSEDLGDGSGDQIDEGDGLGDELPAETDLILAGATTDQVAVAPPEGVVAPAEADADDDVLITDEVEASLDVILAERMRARDDAEEEAEDEEELDDSPNQLATVIPVRRPEEFLCQSCFLLKPPGQLADRDHQLCRDCA